MAIVNTCIIGGGASGMFAAILLARAGVETTILEKSEKTCKKVYITGKGRCNLTNDTLPQEVLNNVVNGSKFLRSAMYKFTPQDTMSFFEDLGVELVVERGNRVFPKSGKSASITDALRGEVKALKVNVEVDSEVTNISKNEDVFHIEYGKNKWLDARNVLICTGGMSYPLTGSTGDGYTFAKKFGHSIVTPVPALNSIVLKEDVKALEGISLKNVKMHAYTTKRVASEFGEMLFTDDGISGPIVLTISSLINRLDNVSLVLDLKPALDEEQLNARLLREFDIAKNSDIKNVMKELLPERLILYVLKEAGIDPSKKVNNITKEERIRLIKALKGLRFNVKKISSIESATVTSGGVETTEINPGTMESKLVNGLYFAGEVIDVDAFTGGFNLQIAFSTAYVAANAIIKNN